MEGQFIHHIRPWSCSGGPSLDSTYAFQCVCCVCVCVCVCVLPIYFSDSSSDQGGTCALLCSAFRGLVYTLQRIFAASLNQTGSRRRGRTLGRFSSFVSLQTSSCGACLRFYREIGAVVPSLVATKSNLVDSRSLSVLNAYDHQLRK